MPSLRRGMCSVFVYCHLIIWSVFLFCAYSDIREYRIPNGAICLGIAVGCLEAAAKDALFGFWLRFFAVLLPGSVLFFLGMTGSGDVKLAALMAAWKGFSCMAAGAAMGLVFGAVLALVRMLRSGSICQRFQYFIFYFNNMIQQKELKQYYVASRDGRECVIPLGTCFCVGFIIAVLFVKGGISTK